MSLKWYSCNYCGTSIKKESSPSSSGCPKHSSHNWHNLGEVGDINYQCKNCGIVVQTKSSPSSYGCSSSSSHNWTRM